MKIITESKIVPLLIIFIVALGIFIIPFRIIGYGFLPPDDSLRHAAKVISGKNWTDILVLRDDFKMDSHPGWHAILGLVYKFTKWDAHSLVLFSIIALFVLLCMIPILMLRRPEAWALALMTIGIANPSFVFRFVLGRPYIFTMAVFLIIFIMWPKLKTEKPPYPITIFFTFLMALSTWIHGTWYLLFLPAICFALAREWRASFLLYIATTFGIFLGACFTGHPILFLSQTMRHVFLSLGGAQFQRLLVSEFQPYVGDYNMVIVICFLLIWRALQGKWYKKVIDNPVFIFGVICWISGYITRRIWIDLGVIAAAVWISQEYQDFLESHVKEFSFKRLYLVLAATLILYLATTGDVASRWSEQRPLWYLSAEDKDLAGWMPEPGGIIYSDDMSIFYQTFFKNPHADWKYVLGFEPGIMKPEDLKTYREIQLSYRAFSQFAPWVKKMKPQDRMILRHSLREVPKIDGLEWHDTNKGIWIGRIPKEKKDANKQPAVK